MPTNLYLNTHIPMKIAVFASGTGTNFDRIYEKQIEYQGKGTVNYAVVDLVFSNNPDSKVVEKAKKLGIKTASLSSSRYFKILEKSADDEFLRETYDSAVISLVEYLSEPDLIVLAGYRRKLGKIFLERYKNRIINLFPGDTTKKYLVKGKPAYLQAIENGENSIRCTCYIENDSDKRFGTAIAQSEEIPLNTNGDNPEEKIRKDGEWKLFPYVVHDLIANGKVEIDDNQNIYINGQKVEESGLKL